MDFYGRRYVFDDLHRRLDRIRETGTGQLLAVRGRRQVGKSRLFTRFVERAGLPYLYFTAVKNAPPTAQLQTLTADMHTSTTPLKDAETLFAAPPADWRDALGRIAVACRDTPSVVVIDEFPWAAGVDPTLEGQLQNAWDRQLEHAPVLFVLIGSDVTMMERLTEHDRPLYGRAKNQTISPFNPAECAEALGPDTDPMAAFDAALVTGGYPRLVADRARVASTATFVHEQLGDENSDLAVMGQRSLDAEFPDAQQARRVLSAIGGTEVGSGTFSQVVGRLPEAGTTAQTAVTRAIRVLSEKGVVAVDVPVGSSPGSRLRRYRIADPCLRFWFRFVEEQLPHIARGRPDIARSAFDRGWPSWRGRAVEPLVQDAVSRLSLGMPGLQGAGQAGSWWNRDNSVEYDIALPAAAGREVLLVGSVKWRENKRFGARDLDRLADARHRVPGADTARLLAVCPAGLADGVRPDLALTPADLLSAWQN
ncbi:MULTISPECIES: ATP-binding protein [unclassified Streptomyces]|uniref:ATP-binding protein n=1 Tax=unclassified Streptomyces TaxID=2593676 RepID=UPI002E2073D8|nr:ATP-binding protein [Streptomyces sp. NBC_01023]